MNRRVSSRHTPCAVRQSRHTECACYLVFLVVAVLLVVQAGAGAIASAAAKRENTVRMTQVWSD